MILSNALLAIGTCFLQGARLEVSAGSDGLWAVLGIVSVGVPAYFSTWFSGEVHPNVIKPPANSFCQATQVLLPSRLFAAMLISSFVYHLMVGKSTLQTSKAVGRDLANEMQLSPSIAVAGFGLAAAALFTCLMQLISCSATLTVGQDFVGIIILPLAIGAMQDTLSAIIETPRNLSYITDSAVTKILNISLCYWPLTICIGWFSGRAVTFSVPGSDSGCSTHWCELIFSRLAERLCGDFAPRRRKRVNLRSRMQIFVIEVNTIPSPSSFTHATNDNVVLSQQSGLITC